MSVDPQELAAFKATLARTPVSTIIKRLDDNSIARTWKRNLAEAEVARRARDDDARAKNTILSSILRHRNASLRAWAVTVFIIVCALAIAAALIVGLQQDSKDLQLQKQLIEEQMMGGEQN